MNPIVNAIVFLGNFVVTAYVYILLLRLLMQKYRVSWHNPLAQFVIRLTDPCVKPLRRWIPGLAGFDLSIVLLALLIQLIFLVVVDFFIGADSVALLGLLVVSIAMFFSKCLNVFFVVICVAAISSWFSGMRHHPLVVVCIQITAPWYQRIRRWLPPIAGLDLSPIILLVMIQLVKILLVTPLHVVAMRMTF